MKQFTNGYEVASIAIERCRAKTKNYTGTSDMPEEGVNEAIARRREG